MGFRRNAATHDRRLRVDGQVEHSGNDWHACRIAKDSDGTCAHGKARGLRAHVLSVAIHRVIGRAHLHRRIGDHHFGRGLRNGEAVRRHADGEEERDQQASKTTA